MLYGVLKPLTAGLCRLYFRLEAHGRDNVPRQGPVLLVANHSSVLDPPVIGALLHRQMAFLAKAELFRIPLFGGLRCDERGRMPGPCARYSGCWPTIGCS
jgi:1-acyl-sn-glycerol-3-phosphate acyltransferase